MLTFTMTKKKINQKNNISNITPLNPNIQGDYSDIIFLKLDNESSKKKIDRYDFYIQALQKLNSNLESDKNYIIILDSTLVEKTEYRGLGFYTMFMVTYNQEKKKRETTTTNFKATKENNEKLLALIN